MLFLSPWFQSLMLSLLFFFLITIVMFCENEKHLNKHAITFFESRNRNVHLNSAKLQSLMWKTEQTSHYRSHLMLESWADELESSNFILIVGDVHVQITTWPQQTQKSKRQILWMIFLKSLPSRCGLSNHVWGSFWFSPKATLIKSMFSYKTNKQTSRNGVSSVQFVSSRNAHMHLRLQFHALIMCSEAVAMITRASRSSS